MVTVVVVDTDVVVTVKFAVVAPAATVTLDGTVAAAESSERVTTAPPLGAAALKVTVPVEELPPPTVVGLSDIAESTGPGGAVTLSDVDGLRCSSAEMLTVVSVDTGDVEIGKVALVAPALTVTLAGTLATPVFPLKSCTTAPPAGAAPASVTVPVDEPPPLTVLGASETEIAGGKASAGGPTVRPRLALLVPYAAVSVTAVEALAVLFVTNANEPLVEPLLTNTDDGSDENSSGWFVEILKYTPPTTGTGAARLTVAMPPSPPFRFVTLAVIDETVTPVTAPTVRTWLRAAPSKCAVMVTLRVDGTPVVKIRNEWLVEPATTYSSLAEAAAASGSLLVKRTTASWKPGHLPSGIGPLKVSVPFAWLPPVTDVGEIVIDVNVGKFAGRT
jgi:hypothetical protein